MTDYHNITHLYGLLGFPLSHSFSKKYFQEKFEREKIEGALYQNFEIEHIELLNKVLEDNPLICGLNVTIPHKERIISLLNELDEDAAQIGAVNVVKCSKKGRVFYLKGYNTDYYGFKTSLNGYLKGNEKFALVLGNGGAAKAVIYALMSLKIDYKVVSRKQSNDDKNISYEELSNEVISRANIIVNTTPLGMWPKVDAAPDIPYFALTKGTIAFDLIYNPEYTKFMRLAEENGAIVVNGLEMLKLQAEKAWQIFSTES